MRTLAITQNITLDGAIEMLGSITLARALIEAGLVDEYRLFVYPVVQGSGRSLTRG